MPPGPNTHYPIFKSVCYHISAHPPPWQPMPLNLVRINRQPARHHPMPSGNQPIRKAGRRLGVISMWFLCQIFSKMKDSVGVESCCHSPLFPSTTSHPDDVAILHPTRSNDDSDHHANDNSNDHDHGECIHGIKKHHREQIAHCPTSLSMKEA